MTLVNLFQDVSLTCRAEGQPSPVINWFKDNEAIPNQHESTYFIDEIQLNQRGDYYCEASNIRGTIRSNEVLVNIRGQSIVCCSFVMLFKKMLLSIRLI